MKYIAIALLAFGVGYGGAALVESGDHQESHMQKMEARWR